MWELPLTASVGRSAARFGVSQKIVKRELVTIITTFFPSRQIKLNGHPARNKPLRLPSHKA